MEKLYCYCIFQQNDLNERVNIKNKCFISHEDIVLLCESMKSNINATKEGILKHDKVIRDVFKQRDVIPISYGMVTESREQAEKFLMKNYSAILKLFQKVENKIEVSLKLTWKEEGFSKDIEDKEIVAFKKQLANKKKITEQDKIELGKMVEERVNDLRQKYADEITNRLKDYTNDFLISEGITPRMALNASFLVDKANEKKFDEAINELYQKYIDIFNFKYIGPLPPYSFINEKFEID
ncbi:MAG: hypothetical protein A2Y24_01710 [Clostridiales bacterium GWE2_32_10]|nr:MAG: hypothetical protein A2Y24_01710 [Clostridiales bacterium GWE2_32_10]HBY19676.1 hypothetical protein [Clostridiales bacterium]